jgi:glycosyltransferase involved in cell wall biosynthesis
MKILHVTPHLGGGVGKAHAALRGVFPSSVEQTFALLEAPRDRRHADTIAAAGAHVTVADHARVADLAAAADVVQFEFWNHPRLFECLARAPFPAMRSVFWSHISGLAGPVIQPGLIAAAGRFVFTTEASLGMTCVAKLSQAERARLAVINSGFGFAGAPGRTPRRDGPPVIAYLGTVDFIKMHPGFFDVVDRLDGPDVRVWVWGDVAPAVAARARAMRHPERIEFRGHTADPAAALAAADIFFYPLTPDHYGTAENALVEAMSLGLVPVVMNNPAETAIVRHGETGFVANSIDECADLLRMLLSSPDLRAKITGKAIRHVGETRTQQCSARQFIELWTGLLPEPKRPSSFGAIVGRGPADWFIATQCLPGETWRPALQAHPEGRSKGGLAHFVDTYPGDAALSRLAGVQCEAPR